jgi:hypothetical protein
LKTLRCLHCIGLTWLWQVTAVPARTLSSSHSVTVPSTFNTKVKKFASSRASTTRQSLPCPSNCSNVPSEVIGWYHLAAVNPRFHWKHRKINFLVVFGFLLYIPLFSARLILYFTPPNINH